MDSLVAFLSGKKELLVEESSSRKSVSKVDEHENKDVSTFEFNNLHRYENTKIAMVLLWCRNL